MDIISKASAPLRPQWAVLEGPSSMLDVLAPMLSNGELRHFTEAFGKPSRDGLGDCHEVALALMTDLVVAGRAAGWKWCEGLVTSDPYEHSWLEFDGWAIDASNGRAKGGRVLIAPRAWYRSHQLAQRVTERDAKQTQRELERSKGKR